ncbi:hypothetical protein CWC18_19760 [Pseudoalteromonas aurantia]|uniref:Uncharacterized protein n=1 Tax=Pseudoalteromonas aurantia TaxID=43654 RepID=A0ABY2VS82_9GAMM|nr:hypothetical protein CWC18_19760 [Pseudoalteromonas aurantia]TMO69596.1 hypothetical protein CWC20_20495 [Pseudoalteromonas aurantia]
MVCVAEYKKRQAIGLPNITTPLKKCAKEDKNKPTSLLAKTVLNNVHRAPNRIKPLNVKYMLN